MRTEFSFPVTLCLLWALRITDSISFLPFSRIDRRDPSQTERHRIFIADISKFLADRNESSDLIPTTDQELKLLMDAAMFKKTIQEKNTSINAKEQEKWTALTTTMLAATSFILGMFYLSAGAERAFNDISQKLSVFIEQVKKIQLTISQRT